METFEQRKPGMILSARNLSRCPAKSSIALARAGHELNEG
jgi:hypothetical protein